MKKKVLSLLAVMALTVSALAGCGSSAADTTEAETTTEATAEAETETETEAAGETETAAATEGLKAGFIFLHDENSTYDLNFLNAAKAACEKLGVECVIKTNIPEGQECYEAACELADAGCNFIFADSFGHEDYMIEAAKEYPDVQITADQAKMGYVGAYTYAEVISGYTSFFLGARSVCPTVTMEVTFTGSWYDETAEKEGANKLIEDGCVLISQHADSMGAPTACETAGVPNVSYNGSTASACPNTFLVSSRINWEPYFEYALNCVAAGTAIDTDWCGSLETGSVELTDLGSAVAEGTQEAIDAAKADLIAGNVHVFDISTFTVEGAALESFEADVDTDADYTPDHEVVVDGYFHESGEEFRSAPYFNVQIDGITLLDTAF